ncbi:hypothetical protein KGM_210096 [Danaus plexippus plexippus]|uniref:Uncharacterized protein n=1 Tax=Danaus plexippus plexippus TaxID=278856 RepID=A0A212EVW0_DANPL|nr:hypothetical protein KGM_210096 [Danaus plexippus plexippus]
MRPTIDSQMTKHRVYHLKPAISRSVAADATIQEHGNSNSLKYFVALIHNLTTGMTVDDTNASSLYESQAPTAGYRLPAYS